MCYAVNSAPHSPAKMGPLKQRTTTLVCAINNDMIVYTCERGQVFHLFCFFYSSIHLFYLSRGAVARRSQTRYLASPRLDFNVGACRPGVQRNPELPRRCGLSNDCNTLTMPGRCRQQTRLSFSLGQTFIAACPERPPERALFR